MKKCAISGKPVTAGLTVSQEALAKLCSNFVLSHGLIVRELEKAYNGLQHWDNEFNEAVNKDKLKDAGKAVLATKYNRGMIDAYTRVLELAIWEDGFLENVRVAGEAL